MDCSWLLTFHLSPIDIFTKKQKMSCGHLITTSSQRLNWVGAHLYFSGRSPRKLPEYSGNAVSVTQKSYYISVIEVIYTLSSHSERAYFFPETECLFVTQGKLLKPSSSISSVAEEKWKKKKKTGPGILNRLHHKAGDWVYIPWKSKAVYVQHN